MAVAMGAGCRSGEGCTEAAASAVLFLRCCLLLASKVCVHQVAMVAPTPPKNLPMFSVPKFESGDVVK